MATHDVDGFENDDSDGNDELTFEAAFMGIRTPAAMGGS